MNKSTRYSPEVRQRAVRLVFEHQGEHASAVGRAHFDSEQDWMYAGDVTQMGASG